MATDIERAAPGVVGRKWRVSVRFNTEEEAISAAGHIAAQYRWDRVSVGADE